MDIREFTDRLLDEARRAGISPAQVSVREREDFMAGARVGRLEQFESGESITLTLSGQVNGRTGTASTQALDEESIAMLIDGVREGAEMTESDEQDEILPPEEHYAQVVNYSEALQAVGAQEKIALAMDIDRHLMDADARLRPDSSDVYQARTTFTLRNTLGLDLSHTSNLIGARASAVASEDGQSATGYHLLWGHSLKELDAQEIASGCAKETLLKLHASRMRSGTYPVVVRNSTLANLLSRYSVIFSAENAQKGMSLLSGREGETIASACVTLTDDPLLPWGAASMPFDSEGAATYTKHVIEGGVLKTLLHNRRTALKEGKRTTGNASGNGHVAPSNLFIVPGTHTREELFAQMGEGLYLTEVSGLHAGANTISGDFSILSRGFMVRGGKLAEPVEQFTVAGNFYQMLREIECVANDLLFEGRPVGCPSVRVKQLYVAGED